MARSEALDSDALPDPRRVLAARRLRLLESPLYLLLEPKPLPELEQIVREAIAGGAGIMQLLTETLSDEQAISTGESLARLCHEHAVLFFVNDRPELVEPIGADGVHLEADGASIADARAVIGPACLIGVSAPTAEQLARASEEGADYASVGPVHETPLRPSPSVGYRAVHRSSLEAKLPWFAVGGIDATNVDRTLASGADRIVVARAIADAGDPRAATEALATAIEDRAGRTKSEEANAAARAQLKPFAPGERPAPAAIAAILLAGVALTNLLMLLIGYQPRYALQTDEAKIAQGLFGVAGLGLAVAVWFLKPFALLILQALLILTTVLGFFGLLTSGTLAESLLTGGVTLVCAWLFYRLIRVLARAQTPARASASDD